VAPLPKFRPQLATLVERPPSGPQWLHEVKFDGYRIACSISGGKVRLESRRNNDWTARFAEIAVAAKSLPAQSALLDGEVAIVAPSGVTSFQSLQNAFTGSRSPRTGLTYYVFDLLHIDGRDIAGMPLEERRRECEALIGNQGPSSPIRYSKHFDVDGAALLARVCELGGEGIISKRRDQPYRPGRNDGWLKSKCTKREEFVIGGFTAPAGSRVGIGALLVGHWDGAILRFAGKVGTGLGFTAQYLTGLRRELATLEQDVCPFHPPPPGWIGRHGHWVRPIRRGIVSFTEWTASGTLRHPSFQGFQDEPAPGSASPAASGPPTGPSRAPRAARRQPPPPASDAPPSASGDLTLPLVAVSGIAITSPTRSVYPELGFSKRDLAQFYADIASWMLPYVANRPLTLVRCERPIRTATALRTECRFLPHDVGWHRWDHPPYGAFTFRNSRSSASTSSSTPPRPSSRSSRATSSKSMLGIPPPTASSTLIASCWIWIPATASSGLRLWPPPSRFAIY
jgi:bifunctional non-homologous end joining protein LigD